eukprot:TRINITY_DN15297_c0_g1_i1.p1 TRINITY_DN15297_c0_g1~~TRINITY_DN15297_c0_g1_i1.p1  ORF type:complete len:342 (+),score=113.89 TRINITY_DN15297_c0_g1_i1:64-1089(+)
MGDDGARPATATEDGRYFKEKDVPQWIEKALRYLGRTRPDNVLHGIEEWVDHERAVQDVPVDYAMLQSCRKGAMLGKGSFAKVFLGQLDDGQYVAVKQIEFADAEDEEVHVELAKAAEEIKLMTRVRHVNIVRCFGSLFDVEAKTYSIYMEYVGGLTLAQLTRGFSGLAGGVVKAYARQLVCGLGALHAAGVCHRDVKPENILVDATRRVLKLCDFGCSKQIDRISAGVKNAACTTVAGTPYYMSPEILNDDEGYDGMRADIWSLGATVIQMTTGTLPWPKSHSEMAAIVMISQAQGPPSQCPTADAVGSLCFNFINCCCSVRPGARPTAEELLHHPYVAN